MAGSSFPKTLADLTFQDEENGGSNRNLYRTLHSLRKSTLSIPNRLKSIVHDADFVTDLHDALNAHVKALRHDTEQIGSHSKTLQHQDTPGHAVEYKLLFPLVANERCGSWYIPPHLRIDNDSAISSQSQKLTSSAYFKSTDGHYGQWDFSLRRLNLTLLHVLGTYHGAILVDSTRRGKSFPDALRRTVPIWVSVWNRVLFPEEQHLLSHAVQIKDLEESEVSQIEMRMKGFEHGLRGLNLDLKALRKAAQRPTACVWVNNGEDQSEIIEDAVQDVQSLRDQVSCNILVLCSASRRVVGAEMSEDGYIQGAGDDHEGWAQGLTAPIFWTHKNELMASNEDELANLIQSLIEAQKSKKGQGQMTLIQPTSQLFLAKAADIEIDSTSEQVVIDCNGSQDETSSRVLKLGCREAKLGSKDLRERLPKVRGFVQKALVEVSDVKITVVCSTGKDLSVGVLLVILCLFFDPQGQFRTDSNPPIMDKQSIKQRLAWITSSKPDANPSRATLQAVNSFLIERPD